MDLHCTLIEGFDYLDLYCTMTIEVWLKSNTHVDSRLLELLNACTMKLAQRSIELKVRNGILEYPSFFSEYINVAISRRASDQRFGLIYICTYSVHVCLRALKIMNGTWRLLLSHRKITARHGKTLPHSIAYSGDR